ncbi:hypothetical protein GW17_00045289 [Ensete ventricosum]|nr:hypothetical protein GW17_00045289 [Ensete ventricosum]
MKTRKGAGTVPAPRKSERLGCLRRSDKVPSPTRWLFHPLFAAIGDGHCRTFTASSPIPERTQRLENARRSFAAAKLEPTEMSPVSEFGAAGDG